METDNLDEFLNGSEPQELAPAAEGLEGDEPFIPTDEPGVNLVAEKPAAEPEKAERPRGPDGKFITKGDEEPAAPPAVEEIQHNIPPKALQEERRKRQELEARIAEYEAREAKQPPQAPQAAPDQWDDPEGHTRWLVDRAAEEAEARAIARIEERNIARSAEAARGKYEDFDETVKVFAELSQQNPELGMKLRQAENPGEFAYKTAKTHLEVQQYGSLDALIEAKLAERESAIRAELQPPAPGPSIPSSLADAQSARTGAVVASPPTLDSILGR